MLNKTEEIIDKQGLHDPVCGMSVTHKSEHQHIYHGDSYYFCSSRCHDKFTSEPEKYIQLNSQTKSESDNNDGRKKIWRDILYLSNAS